MKLPQSQQYKFLKYLRKCIATDFQPVKLLWFHPTLLLHLLLLLLFLPAAYFLLSLSCVCFIMNFGAITMFAYLHIRMWTPSRRGGWIGTKKQKIIAVDYKYQAKCFIQTSMWRWDWTADDVIDASVTLCSMSGLFSLIIRIKTVSFIDFAFQTDGFIQRRCNPAVHRWRLTLPSRKCRVTFAVIAPAAAAAVEGDFVENLDVFKARKMFECGRETWPRATLVRSLHFAN